MTFVGWNNQSGTGVIGGGGSAKPGPSEYTVPTLPDRLALTGLLTGDLVTQSDTGERWKLDSQPPATAGNWSLESGGGYGLDTTGFDNALSANENTIQKALDRLDDAVGGTGGLYRIAEADASKRPTPPVPGDLPGAPTEFIVNSEVFRVVNGIFKQRWRAINATTLELVSERLPDSNNPLSVMPPATGFAVGDFFTFLNAATTPDQLEHYQWQAGDLGTGIPTQISYDGNADVADATLSNTSVVPVQNRIITGLFGLPDAATDMGPFTGGTLADAGNVKGHLQTLESSWESLGALINKLGPLREGGVITGSNAALTLGVQAGSWFAWNGLVGEVAETAIPATAPLVFDVVLRNNTIISPGVTTFNPMQFDNGGAVLAGFAQANNAQAFRLYGKPGSNYILMYGQEEYTTLNNARARWQTEPVILPALLDGYRLMAVVLAEGLATATDSLECLVIGASKIGEVGSANSGNVNDLVDVTVTDAAERDAQKVHDGLTIGVRTPQEVWYILDEADGTFANATKVNLMGGSSSSDWIDNRGTPTAAPTVNALNLYPDGTIISTAGLVDNNQFGVMVPPGESVTINTVVYANPASNIHNEPFIFTFIGGVPVRLGGNDVTVSSDVVQKADGEVVEPGRINWFGTSPATASFTGLVNGNQFALLVKPGDTVTLNGVPYTNTGTNNEPYVFSVEGGAPVRLGGNSSSSVSQWVARNDGDKPILDGFNLYAVGPPVPTVDTSSLVDGDFFALMIPSGQSVAVTGLGSISNPSGNANDEPFVVTKQGGVLRQLGGNDTLLTKNWVQKSNNDVPDLDTLNKYDNNTAVNATGLVDGNHFAIIVEPGHTVTVNATGPAAGTYNNAGLNDEPYVFTVRGGALLQLGANGIGKRDTWTQKADNAVAEVGVLNRYLDGTTAVTTGTAAGDVLDILIPPGATVTVDGKTYTAPSGLEDAVFRFVNDGGVIKPIGGSTQSASSSWVQKLTTEQVEVGKLSRYVDGDTADVTGTQSGDLFEILIPSGATVTVDGNPYLANAENAQDQTFRFLNDGGVIRRIDADYEDRFYAVQVVPKVGTGPGVLTGDQQDRQHQTYTTALDEPAFTYMPPTNLKEGSRWRHTFTATTDGVLTLGAGIVGAGGGTSFPFKTGNQYVIEGVMVSRFIDPVIMWSGESSASIPSYATTADLTAVIGQLGGEMAVVTNDPSPTLNGVYIVTGVAPGATGGAWVKT